MFCNDDLDCYGTHVCCDYSCVPPVLNSCYGESCDDDFDCFGDFTCCSGNCYHPSSVLCNPADNLADNMFISIAGIVFFIILIASIVACVRRRRAVAIVTTTRSAVVAVNPSTTGHVTYGGTGQTDPNLHSQYYQETHTSMAGGYNANLTSTTLPPPPSYHEITHTASAKSPLLS